MRYTGLLYRYLLLATSAVLLLMLAPGDVKAQPRCVAGYVWREACLNDFVCVTPDVREAAKVDNYWASLRVAPGGGPYGPDTCLQGYVWREACGPKDHVSASCMKA